MGVHGDDLRQLTHFNSWAGAWSADGTKILVGAQDGLYLLSSTGQQVQQLTDIAPRAFGWSADGEWITYTTVASTTATTVDRWTSGTADSTGEETLWLINRNGGAQQRIATNYLWHQWSPDGAALGYITGNAGTAEPLLYLWTVTPNATPTLVAEVNEPFFAWPR
jgi:Tol biopolymer transport system component